MSFKNLNANKIKRNCIYCLRTCSIANINKHEKTCNKNPSNFKLCPVCQKQHTKPGVTCSYSCSNTHFRSGKNHPNWNKEGYRNKCFEHYGKKCLVCNEVKIVAVHHINENHLDNRIENLIPLCPTHHQYMHSQYKEEIITLLKEKTIIL